MVRDGRLDPWELKLKVWNGFLGVKLDIGVSEDLIVLFIIEESRFFCGWAKGSGFFAGFGVLWVLSFRN